MPDADPAAFPVRRLIEFWNMRGVVSNRPPDRRCVVGGMHRYGRAFELRFLDGGGSLRCEAHVIGVSR